MFDWLTFLQTYSINYVEDGPNVASGNINIHCPFCGPDDPSEHLGISLEGKGWACWRDAEHRGKAPYRLIMALLSCSRQYAQRLVGNQPSEDLSEFDKYFSAVDEGRHPRTQSYVTELKIPDNFDPISKLPRSNRKFWNYLKDRGFDDPASLYVEYGITCCNSGVFSNRVIIPIYYKGELQTWTGRGIGKADKPKYKSLSSTTPAEQQDGHIARTSIRDLLWNYDELQDFVGKVLYITEGPFDALKVDYYGRDFGIRATCLFGLVISDAQRAMLRELTANYTSTRLMLDSTAYANAIAMTSELSDLGVEMDILPEGVDDPGDLEAWQITILV